MLRQMTLMEWLKWRREGICSTDASIIMGAVPESWGTVAGLWLDKTGRPVPTKERTFRMKRGTKLEPVARAAYEKMTGISMPALCVENVNNRRSRATLDGINDEAQRVLEIKCPGKVDHAEAVAGRVPRKYIWQCVHALMVTELPQLDYFSFDGRDGVIVPFLRDLKLEKELYEAEMRFAQLVMSDTPPPRTPSSVEKRLLNENGAKIFKLRRVK